MSVTLLRRTALFLCFTFFVYQPEHLRYFHTLVPRVEASTFRHNDPRVPRCVFDMPELIHDKLVDNVVTGYVSGSMTHGVQVQVRDRMSEHLMVHLMKYEEP